MGPNVTQPDSGVCIMTYRAVQLAVAAGMLLLPAASIRGQQPVNVRVIPVEIDRDMDVVRWAHRGPSGSIIAGIGTGPITILHRSASGVVKQLSRLGDGPGEYRDGSRAFVVGDSLVLQDPLRRARTAISTRSGRGTTQLFPERKHEPKCGVVGIVGSNGLCEGLIVDSAQSRRVGVHARWFRQSDTTRPSMLVATFHDTLGVGRVVWPNRVTTITRKYSFGPRLANSPDGSTIAVLRQSLLPGPVVEYSVQLFDVRTGRSRSWRARAPATRVTRAWREQIVSKFARSLFGSGVARGASYASFKPRVEAAMAIPNALPVATSLFVSNEGCVWLQQPETLQRAGDVLAVHDAAGTRKALAELPTSTHVRSVSCNSAVGVSVDQDDVPTVVLLSLP